MGSFLSNDKNIPTVMMAKLFRQKASRRPQNIGPKAAAAKRPHFAHGCLSPIKKLDVEYLNLKLTIGLLNLSNQMRNEKFPDINRVFSSLYFAIHVQ